RIQKFDSNGNFITRWGCSGTDDGHFQNAIGVAVDAAGNVYVTDAYNNRVQEFAMVNSPEPAPECEMEPVPEPSPAPVHESVPEFPTSLIPLTMSIGIGSVVMYLKVKQRLN
ncbi:MAG TPA: hypothetical protein VLV30_02980, partial [Methanomicrobiales archaeon]|nr:hypothetical protein [Methanomicrobiales archaeon]